MEGAPNLSCGADDFSRRDVTFSNDIARGKEGFRKKGRGVPGSNGVTLTTIHYITYMFGIVQNERKDVFFGSQFESTAYHVGKNNSSRVSRR